jgi:hypothetical protein
MLWQSSLAGRAQGETFGAFHLRPTKPFKSALVKPAKRIKAGRRWLATNAPAPAACPPPASASGAFLDVHT